MPSLRYLNSVLTILAVLLTLNVYALWTAAPPAASTASEVYAQDTGLPNAAKQRKDMIDELKKTNAELSALHKTLTSGKLRVTVDNPPKGD